MPLLLTADTNPGTASWSTADVNHGITVAGLTPPLAGPITPVPAPGANPGDIVLVTLVSDDTGAPLSNISAIVSAPGIVDIILSLPPTAGDGIAQFAVVAPL